MKVEYWVMRVVLHYNGHARAKILDPKGYELAIARVNAGSYVQLAKGDIVEPVEVFETENEAATHREVLHRKHPAEDFRVVLNTDATV